MKIIVHKLKQDKYKRFGVPFFEDWLACIGIANNKAEPT
jgi:hypothetical protein